MINTLQQLKI